MLILGSPNGAKIQHKINQKTDPFLDQLKSCKNPPTHRAHGPGLALNGKSEETFAKQKQLLFRSASQLLGCEAASY